MLATVMPGAMPGPVTAWPTCTDAGMAVMGMTVVFVAIAVVGLCTRNESAPVAPLRVVVPPGSAHPA